MKYSYYPGCTLKTKAKELNDYAIASAKALGIDPDYIVGDLIPQPRRFWNIIRRKISPFGSSRPEKTKPTWSLGLFWHWSWARQTLCCSAVLGTDLTIRLPMRIICFSSEKGVRARLVDDKNCVEVIDQHLTLHGKVGDLVSTLPLSMEVTGITLQGFSYPLTDATLTLDGDYMRSAMYWRRKPQQLISRAAIFM